MAPGKFYEVEKLHPRLATHDTAHNCRVLDNSPETINVSVLALSDLYIYTRRYSPIPRLTSSSCGELRPPAEACFALGAKKNFLCCYAYVMFMLLCCYILKFFFFLVSRLKL